MSKEVSWQAENTQTGEVMRISAIDGHTAWRKLAEMRAMPDFRNPWQIVCVCPVCDKRSGSTCFCSRECFERRSA